MKFVSWNVNGLRAVLNKGFLDYLRAEDPDVICLQESKPDLTGAEDWVGNVGPGYMRPRKSNRRIGFRVM